MRNINTLITGVTGNVGKELVRFFEEKRIPFRAGLRNVTKDDDTEYGEVVHFDFEDPTTFEAAFSNIDQLFLIRPPQLSQVYNQIKPALVYAKVAGVKKIVFLSLQGADKIPVVPHRKIEKIIKENNFNYTFLRPSFFMQNLTTTHLEEIKNDRVINVPAGNGKTNFIDVRDIAEVAFKALTEEGFNNKALELTGSRAYSYYEVAEVLSEVTNQEVTYKNPTRRAFQDDWLKKGYPKKYVNVMANIYFTAKIGFAKRTTKDLEAILNRPPRSLRQFTEDYKDYFN